MNQSIEKHLRKYPLVDYATIKNLLSEDGYQYINDNMQKTHQTGHPSRLHPASKNARHPATPVGDDPAI
ncbi:MAG: hypothetical protein COB07_12070, partial [Sulfurovum sp.]